MTDNRPMAEQPGPGQAGPQAPRLHVDTDWKRQAQAEKQRLAREIEAAEQTARPTSPQPSDQTPGPLPEASFSTLVQTLATQAAIFLSDQRDPETGQPLRHLDLAKHHIDLLAVLEEKTKGNLTDDERRLLDSLLYELRMAYIEAAS